MDSQYSYKYLDVNGAPFVGVPPLLSSEEYSRSVRTCKVARTGIFDVANRGHTIAGRTLEEVLTRHSLGQYTIMYMREYQHGATDDGIPRVFLHVIWYEKFDVHQSKFVNFVEEGVYATTTASNRRSSTAKSAVGSDETNSSEESEKPVDSVSGGGDDISWSADPDTFKSGSTVAQADTGGQRRSDRVIWGPAEESSTPKSQSGVDQLFAGGAFNASGFSSGASPDQGSE